MPSYSEPVLIGFGGTEFNADPSLVTNASHTLTSDSTNVYGTTLTEGFFPEANYCTGAALYINSNLDDNSFDSFSGIEVAWNIASMPGNLYGVRIDSPAAEGPGGTNQYGLFIDTQDLATNNYAIYTNAGANVLGDSLLVGNGNELGGNTTITTNATHTLSNDSTNCYGMALTESYFPTANYCTGAAVYINTNIDDGSFDSFSGIEIAWNISSVPGNFYGIRIDTPSAEGGGGTNQYGLFIDSQNLATHSYAIYTNDGDVRFGSLAGTGNRTVMVNSDGVLFPS